MNELIFSLTTKDMSNMLESLPNIEKTNLNKFCYYIVKKEKDIDGLGRFDVFEPNGLRKYIKVTFERYRDEWVLISVE